MRVCLTPEGVVPGLLGVLMVSKSGRTSTTKWKKLRVTALVQAQNQNITHCRYCRVMLDYSSGRKSNSATPDHIIPFKHGGADTLENLQIICRTCNAKMGDKQKPEQMYYKPVTVIAPETEANW